MRIGDSQLVKIGASRYDLTDPYTVAVTMSWPLFFAALISLYLTINLIFACLYASVPGAIANARPGSFTDAFFFSIETLATVGYGVMAPATLYGHAVSSIEILCGLIFTALVTGLIFVRFSKPKPNLLFAEEAVIAQHNGLPTLMVRLANGRSSLLSGANAKLTVLKLVQSSEGRSFRHAFELKLARSHLPAFVLTWTLMHRIDEESPLYGLDAEGLTASNVLLILTIEARDHALGSTIFDMHSYSSQKILFGMIYQDTITYDEDGKTRADLTKLSAVELDGTHEALSGALRSQGIV